MEYDRLVVTIGAQTNTFGIPGVREHCNFLKEVEDARRIRTAIVNCFERANLPDLTDEEKVKNLTFAIIGAGPTGIECTCEESGRDTKQCSRKRRWSDAKRQVAFTLEKQP